MRVSSSAASLSTREAYLLPLSEDELDESSLASSNPAGDTKRLLEVLFKEESDDSEYGPFTDSETDLEAFVNQCRQTHGADGPLTSYAKANLAFVQKDAKYGAFMDSQRDCVTELMKTAGEKNLMTLLAASRFAKSLSTSPDADLLVESANYAQFSIDGFRELGDFHNLSRSMSTLSTALVALSRSREAISLLEDEVENLNSQNAPAEAVNEMQSTLLKIRHATP